MLAIKVSDDSIKIVGSELRPYHELVLISRGGREWRLATVIDFVGISVAPFPKDPRNPNMSRGES